VFFAQHFTRNQEYQNRECKIIKYRVNPGQWSRWRRHSSVGRASGS